MVTSYHGPIRTKNLHVPEIDDPVRNKFHSQNFSKGKNNPDQEERWDVPTTSDSAQKAATLLYPKLPVDEQYKFPMNPGYTETGMCCWFYEV